MQLVNRVSAFFLAALLAALVGYSVALFLAVRYYLHSEFDDRLQGALQILAASVEIESSDVTWNPAEYTLEFDREMLRDARWAIADERGELVDHSPQLSQSRPEDAALLEYARTRTAREGGTVERGTWRIVQRYLSTPTPKAEEQREWNEYASLVVTVARSRAELDATTRRIAMLLCTLSAIVWSIAALSGRGYVRRSLRPLTAMADRARSTIRPDFEMRLPLDPARGELYELGASFNQLLDQLQEAFERERRFAEEAAHQLRTPLTVLQGHIEVAQRRPRTTDDYRQTLSVLMAQVDELRQIVESLLILARCAEDGHLPKMEPLMLSQWLPDYVDRWQTHPRSSDLAMQLQSDPCVPASIPLLTQLLDNLITNALKYSEAGTRVVLEVTCQTKTAELAVVDQGIGVPETDRQAIFAPFFRSASARHTGVGGTGLGLAVARRIANLLGADLACRATPGTGSTFVLTLPLCDMAELQGTA